MKLALITDTHFGARNDSHTFYRFLSKFYDNVFFPYLIDNDISTIYHLGDIVERRKFINYVTLNHFRNTFLGPIIDNGMKAHIIVGNHDVPYRNSNEINAMSELVGSNSDGIHFYSEPTTVREDSLDIALVPWINHTNYDDTMKFISKTTATVLFGHLEINGFEMYRGMKADAGMDVKPFDGFDLVFSGHFHHKSNRGNIYYLGNPYEITWNDYNDPRGFHIFDTETRQLEFIRNPYQLFFKVWYDDTDKTFEEVIEIDLSKYEDTYVKVIVQNKTNPYWFDIFMDNLYKTNPANVTIVDDNKNMDALTEEEIINEAEDTMTILDNYVSNLTTNVDKQKLKQLFHTLYLDAQNVDI